MLERLNVENYRSLRNVTIELGQLTVVTGGNGTGKSNFYRALQLVQAAANGQFAAALLAEGGMPSALWAGNRTKGAVRMKLQTHWSDISHEIHAGLPQLGSSSPFVLDPEVKDEYVYMGRSRTPSSMLVERSRAHATSIDTDGAKRSTMSLVVSESLLGQMGDPMSYPEVDELQRRVRGWRFYHQFESGPSSPIRKPQPGIRTAALASDGSDLGAAIATIADRGDRRALDSAVNAAFPGYQVVVTGEPGMFEVGMRAPGLNRPLSAQELSDGQLRFLCLATALLSTRPPEMLVLNEPETSLHPSAVLALTPLIIEASTISQVWVTTHDVALAEHLGDNAVVSSLELRDGGTHVTQHGR